MIMALLGGGLFISGLLVTFWDWMPFLSGYPVLVDLIVSWWALSSFIATGTASGMLIGGAAILISTVTIRLWRKVFGYKRFVYDGQDSLPAVVAGALTTSVKWIRSTLFGLFISGRVKEPLGDKWYVQTTPGFGRK